MTAGQSNDIQRRDAGLSLVELVVTMGIFGTLMVLVSGVLINGLGSIREAAQFSDVQQDQRNAMLVISSALRYTDNATEGVAPGPAITAATPTSMQFFTVAALGDVTGYPYEVTLAVTAAEPNPGLVMSVRQPIVSSGAVTGYSAPADRALIRTTNTTTPSIDFTYYVQQEIGGQATTVATSPPAPSDPAAFAAWASSVDSIRVVLSDSASGLTTEQTIVLVNPR